MRYRVTGSRNPPPRVILPFTGLAAGSRNPPPKVILQVAGRRDAPPGRLRPPSVVEVFMADSNLDDPIAERIAPSGTQRSGKRDPRNRRAGRLVFVIPGFPGCTDPCRLALTNKTNTGCQEDLPCIGGSSQRVALGHRPSAASQSTLRRAAGRARPPRSSRRASGRTLDFQVIGKPAA
jgi:hypothetical protein